MCYNLVVRSYSFYIKLASFFNTKARLFVQGRKNLLPILRTTVADDRGNITWFHAASLGEFEQGLPVMEAYKALFPSRKLLVTFFSPSGFEERKNHPIADFVFYLPIDTRSNASEFFDAIDPIDVFFVKYEYWFHYLKEANRRKVPLYSISALFTEEHVFFKWYGGFHRKMLHFFDHTFVQNDASLQLIHRIGIDAASISGDTRFDRVLKTIEGPNHYEPIKHFKGASRLMVVGSAWPADMEMLAAFINSSDDRLKFIVAPHLIDDQNVRRIIANIEKSTHRYSQGEQIPDHTQVLILDTMGMLSSVYQYGDFAYIGGAFGDGLHNILEAVAFGLPVVFGNKGLEKFPESIELQKLGGAFSIDSQSGASETLNKLNEDQDFRQSASQACRKYVQDNAGATSRIMDYLKRNSK